MAHASHQVGFEETKNYKNIFTVTESPMNTKSVKAWFHVFPMTIQEALLVFGTKRVLQMPECFTSEISQLCSLDEESSLMQHCNPLRCHVDGTLKIRCFSTFSSPLNFSELQSFLASARSLWCQCTVAHSGLNFLCSIINTTSKFSTVHLLWESSTQSWLYGEPSISDSAST